jgi:Flp pilus assembly protein TadD
MLRAKSRAALLFLSLSSTCCLAICAQTSDVLGSPSFSARPDALRQRALLIKPEKDADATILLNEQHYSVDAAGKLTETYHMIYRVENEEGVKGWDSISENWEPWHQAKPEIKARVITLDGVVHQLDPETLNDVPAHENSPDLYSDGRAYGGPFPAVAVGAIVEEEIVVRDVTPFFAGGTVRRSILSRQAAVSKTRVVFSHPEAVPFRYALHLMPDAVVTKSSKDGIESIVIENGPLAAETEPVTHLPPDVFSKPQVEFATGTSWQQVAAEYVRLSEHKLRTADVQSMVARLVKTGEPRADSIRHLVNALHRTVRYTGVEFGESSLVPQFPAETLKRKYGDCKDKSTLLVAMLRAAGIPAKLVLLQTGPGLDSNPDLPGMGEFDHAIVLVPASGSDPDLWIDATASYTQVGSLPLMDYGRWALIVDPATTALRKIPDVTYGVNMHRETREFKMAEFGLAEIRETNEQIGATEDNFRSFYDGEPKSVRENSEKYVKNMYLADSLIALEHGDLTDIEKPLLVTYVTKGKRGSTDLTSATMAIRQETIFDGYPDFFYTKEQKSDAENKEDKPKPRTLDWWINPFATEWHYKVIAPVGFKLRALPLDKEQHLVDAHYSQKYTANPDGTVVEAVFRFESGKQRLTPAEAVALRDEIIKAREADPILISFDRIGYTLLSQGKIKEALAAGQQLISLHPKEALHRIQLADMLLAVGMVERARSEAKAATVLDPKSAQAYSTLGLTLEYDLIGRRFKKGFDYSGAVAAYRRAKELDPKDKDIRASLAFLLEYDSQGTRYSATARLEDAAAEFQELKKFDEDFARKYEDNPLYDLWYAKKVDAVVALAESMPGADIRKSFLVAATAAREGSEAAIKKSLGLSTVESTRGQMLVNAGAMMMRIGRYAEAADLFAAGGRAQGNENQYTATVNMLRQTKRWSEAKFDASDPGILVQGMFALMFQENPDYDQIPKFTSKRIPPPSDPEKEKRDYRQASFTLRSFLAANNLPLPVLEDLTLSNVKLTKEGDEELGYRVTLEIPGGQPQEVFAVKEGGEYKVVEWSASGSSSPENIGWIVLDLVEKKDLAGARKWLDWARDKVHINTGDDPLSGQPFPYFWSKGREGDEAAIRTAALVLLPSKALKPQQFAALAKLRDDATSPRDHNLLNLVLAYGYDVQEKWTELTPVAEELMKAEPDSLVAFKFATHAYAQTKAFDQWDKQLQVRMPKHPDELEYVRSASQLALYRGDVRKSRELLKGLEDRGKANSSDLNGYAWEALQLSTGVDQDSLDAIQKANEKTKDSFAILHTMACLYAAAQRGGQSREAILKAVEAAKLEEPNSEVWFAYGMIAEQFGESDAARGMYARVEKPKLYYPGSSYELAQQRLAALSGKPSETGSKSAK